MLGIGFVWHSCNAAEQVEKRHAWTIAERSGYWLLVCPSHIIIPHTIIAR